MAKGEAYLEVTCDRCGHLQLIQLHVTGGGNYSEDNVDRELESQGWRVDDDELICDECIWEIEAEDKEEEDG